MTDPVFALEPDIPRNVRIARWLLFRLLSGIRGGSLTLREGAQTFHFGETSAALHADVQILSPGVYWRVLTGVASPPLRPGWMANGKPHSSRHCLRSWRLTGRCLAGWKRDFVCSAGRLNGFATGRGETHAPRLAKILPRITIWATPLCPFSG